MCSWISEFRRVFSQLSIVLYISWDLIKLASLNQRILQENLENVMQTSGLPAASTVEMNTVVSLNVLNNKVSYNVRSQFCEVFEQSLRNYLNSYNFGFQ